MPAEGSREGGLRWTEFFEPCFDLRERLKSRAPLSGGVAADARHRAHPAPRERAPHARLATRGTAPVIVSRSPAHRRAQAARLTILLVRA